MSIPTASGKFRDLSGKTYESLLVLKRVENNKHGQVMYLCKCECGLEVTASAGKLRSGERTSCGCEKKDRMRLLNEQRRLKEENKPWNKGVLDLGKFHDEMNIQWRLNAEIACVVFEFVNARMRKNPPLLLEDHSMDRIDRISSFDPTLDGDCDFSYSEMRKVSHKSYSKKDLGWLDFLSDAFQKKAAEDLDEKPENQFEKLTGIDFSNESSC